ncbi:MAG: DNA polymerase I [Oscillospiraceae bacterium]|nr:DNA polymerase I [Oscillospiraceae bacterium]
MEANIESRNSLAAIDGNSILNRVYYGIRPLTTKDGKTTHAVYGFLNILQKLLNELSPGGVCVSFDLPGKTFRHEMYDGYKAARKPMPDDLADQMVLTRQVLAALRIPVYEAQGYEADDVLGTIGRISAEKGWLCHILTGDRDSYQLINQYVGVIHAGGKEWKTHTPETIREIYGLDPIQLIDLKALQGDASDQIPGVPGIGEKSAIALMQEYGSLDAIYQSLGNIPEKFRKKLEPGKELAYLSRKLGEINQNVPIYFDPGQTVRHKPDKTELRDVFLRLEFSQKMLETWLPSENTLTEGVNLSLFAPELELPQEVGRNIKEHWRQELETGKPLTHYEHDIALAAWMLGTPERQWEDMQEQMHKDGLWELYEKVEVPLCRVLAGMEYCGVTVDKDKLTAYRDMLCAEIEGLQERIYGVCGCEFNILSPKQLGSVLFEKLELSHGKKNKTGWSTDADTLEGLRQEHPAVQLILEYRTISKLKSTYADGLLRAMDGNNRVHSTFQMTASATGRLSSTEPNLQNIPVRQPLGAKLREMFIAHQPGWVLCDADYSQIELRVLAHISGDAVMRQAFKDGQDIHTATACQVFNARSQDITPLMRHHAKAVNFGIVYGISDFSLAGDIGVSRAEAKAYIESYLSKYAGVRAYMERIVQQAREQGYVTTLFGRRRTIPELSSRNHNIRKFGERVALNTPIQGTSADIIKAAMVAVDRRLRKEKLHAHLILQIHDELIAECPENEAERVKEILSYEMEHAFPMDPPLKAEAHTGYSWAQAKT